MSTDGTYDAFADQVENLDLDGINSEEDLRAYDYPKEAWYHLMVSSVDLSREKLNAMKVEFQVLAGERPTEVGKTFTENFWDPDPSANDGGKFGRKRRAAFALACGLLTPDELSSGSKQVVWAQARGRQVVAKVNNYSRKTDSGKTYEGAQIDGLKIYRLDAPEAVSVPKNMDALALLGSAAPQQCHQMAAPAASGSAPGQQTAAPAATGGTKWDGLV